MEEDLWKEIEEYIVSWELERRRSKTSNAKANGTEQQYKSGEPGARLYFDCG